MAIQSNQSVIDIKWGKSTINEIVDEVCDAIWESLADFVKTPTTPQDWENIINDFDEIWNIPHCLGAIDGKHIAMRQLKRVWKLSANYRLIDTIC